MLASSLGGRVASEDWVKLLPLLESAAHQITPDSKERQPDDVVQNEAAITETGYPSPSGTLRCCIHNAFLQSVAALLPPLPLLT